MCDLTMYPGKIPQKYLYGEPIADEGKINFPTFRSADFAPPWIAFDEAAEIPVKALDDMADAERDRRLRALEDQVTRLLASQDRQIANYPGVDRGVGPAEIALKAMRKIDVRSRKAVLKPKPAKRKKR